ncbi:hypothetical protein L2E82_20227 [Cichorium intybus]|uniref:Uncharacterized protein n=1 Tax=Cichorium intybus TaxID=13427 RepID=A0ACB9DTG7_CICIN|nr:hypothetical protein L2E82_20227 [Cichorium intybus]
MECRSNYAVATCTFKATFIPVQTKQIVVVHLLPLFCISGTTHLERVPLSLFLSLHPNCVDVPELHPASLIRRKARNRG